MPPLPYEPWAGEGESFPVFHPASLPEPEGPPPPEDAPLPAVAPQEPLPLLTATVTMCRRLPLFIQTMDSLLQNLEDRALIAEWIAIDDGSSAANLAEVARRYPFLRLMIHQGRGHAGALNELFRQVKTRYLFHFEDDWLFLTPGRMLTQCLAVLRADPVLGQVSLRGYGGELREPTDVPAHYIHQHPPSHWPGYSLNPGVQDMNKVRQAGEFPAESGFEYRFARQFHVLGHRVAYLKPPADCQWIRHLGQVSDYNLNETRR